MTNKRLCVELKTYKPDENARESAWFRAVIIKRSGINLLVERDYKSIPSVIEKAIEEFCSATETVEIEFKNITINEGEKEYLSDKYRVIFV